MFELGYAVAGGIIGFIVGLTGVGGGALMTPVLLFFFGINPTTAVATDLWFAAVTKTVAIFIHHEDKKVDWAIAKNLWVGSIPAAILLVVCIGLGITGTITNYLPQIIGFVIIITALGILFSRALRGASIKKSKLNKEQKAKRTRAKKIITGVAGVLLGTLVTLTSVGAGALGTVFLIYLYPRRLTPHKLVGTDILHAIPLTIVGGIGYLFIGAVDLVMLSSLLIGSIPCAVLGSLATRMINAKWLKTGIGIALFLAGTKLLLG